MKNIFTGKKIKLFILSALAFLWTFFAFQSSASAGELNFHSVYVGRGDAIVIESRGHYMIVDSGTSSGAPLLTKYLKNLNIPDKKIDYLISTHPDGDHVGGFPDVFENYDIGQVIYSPCTKASSYYYDFINSVKAEGCPFRTPVEGESWQLGDALVQVIYNGSQGSTYNECSIVLKVICDKKSILLTGDLPSTMERPLMEKGYNFKADIIKIGHHGAAASSCADFLDTVKPQYAVISCDRSKDTVLPKPSVLMRLARRFIKTYRTSDRDVVMKIKNGVISTSNIENNGYISIKKGKITLSNNVFYATGKEIKPSVTLYVNGKLVPSNHYKISYSSNKNTGTANIKLTATEVKYVSVCRTTFLILPKKETLSATLSGYNKAKLSWSSQSHATGFQIKYTTDKSFKKNVKYITCNSPKTVKKTISSLKFNTKYYFKVRAYKSNIGNGKWSSKVSLKTKTPPLPEKGKLMSANLSGKSNIKLSWKKQKSSHKAGYILQYSTDKTFKNIKEIKTVTYKNTSKNYRTLRRLKRKKTYYIRIRGYNKYGNGKWSKIKKIKTK